MDSQVSKPAAPRWFFYSGFVLADNGDKIWFEGCYQDTFDPQNGTEHVIKNIAKARNYDPNQTHLSSFTPL
jgi:hypothetical protein